MGWLTKTTGSTGLSFRRQYECKQQRDKRHQTGGDNGNERPRYRIIALGQGFLYRKVPRHPDAQYPERQYDGRGSYWASIAVCCPARRRKSGDIRSRAG